MARLFRGGSGSSEVVKTIVSGDIVVVVLVERNEVSVEGVTDPQPWILRTTQVFETRDGTWVRLHRHADPLIDRRTPARYLRDRPWRRCTAAGVGIRRFGQEPPRGDRARPRRHGG
jgi:hypothetical protein